MNYAPKGIVGDKRMRGCRSMRGRQDDVTVIVANVRSSAQSLSFPTSSRQVEAESKYRMACCTTTGTTQSSLLLAMFPPPRSSSPTQTTPAIPCRELDMIHYFGRPWTRYTQKYGNCRTSFSLSHKKLPTKLRTNLG